MLTTKDYLQVSSHRKLNELKPGSCWKVEKQPETYMVL